jgi:hypothetical protein
MRRYRRLSLFPQILLGYLLFCLSATSVYPIDGADYFMAHPPSLIQNGNFENALFPWWGPGASLAPGQSASGKSALRIDGGYAVQEKIHVSGGKRYRLTLSMRSIDAPKQSVYVQISFRGQGVNPGWYGPLDIDVGGNMESAVFVSGDTRDWEQLSSVIEAPAGGAEILIYLRKRESTAGVALFDAVSLTETDEPATTTDVATREALATDVLTKPLSSGEVELALAKLIEAARRGTSPPRHILANNQKASIQVHVGSYTDIITLYAAADLADNLHQITGGKFTPLSHDRAPVSGPVIVVGKDNELARKLVPDAAFQGLGNEGFIIRSVGPHIFIAGATARGTMYAVNWFLDRKLGIHWLSPDVTYMPHAPALSVEQLDERQIPRFDYREVLSVEAENKIWRARNLMNGESHGPSFSKTSPEIDSWEHGWNAKDTVATFYELLPPARYMKSHPEWFAGGQLAMMNPGVRKVIADAVIERLRRCPDYKNMWFALHDMAWGWDMDPASKSFAEQHGGTPSAPRLDMMINIANQVRAALPGARFAFNAYHWSFTPPAGMQVPDYILVYPMTIHVDYSHPLNEATNKALGRDLAEWNAISDRILVWDHIANFAGFIQPTPNLYAIARSIKWLSSLPHVRGYFGEGTWDTPGAEFASLRAWLISRLLWNPAENIDDLITDYCEKYYGPAGELIKNYIALEHAAIRLSGDMLGEKAQVDAKMFDLSFIQEADKLLESAESKVRGTPYFSRVRQARLPLDYVILVRRKEYADVLKLTSSGWAIDSDARSKRFWQEISSANVRQYYQGGDVAELRELLAIERRTASPPRPLASATPDEWVDFQDLSVNRYGGSRIVSDPIASDGAAVRMDPSSSGWNVQFKFDKLPKSNAWWLYASIRTQAKGGTDLFPAIRVGSYPSMSCFTMVDLADGQYHLVEIPGGPFRHNTDHSTGAYIQLVPNPLIKAIFVDRFVATKNRLNGSAALLSRGCS